MPLELKWENLTVQGCDKRLITDQLTYSNDVRRIVGVMEDLLDTGSDIFPEVVTRGRTRLTCCALGKRFLSCLKIDVKEISRRYRRHKLNPLFTLFKWHTRALRRSYLELDVHSAAQFRLVVDQMRAWLSGQALPRRLDRLERGERANWRSVRTRLDGLRASRSKVVAVRLDLEYYALFGSAGGFSPQAVTVNEARAHRSAFVKYLRKGPYSKHMVGYTWAMEAGFEKGVHFHFAVFFDGQQVCRDIVLGDALGKHWETITDGRGYAFNCNKRKEQYLYLGIGMLNRADDLVWANLHKAVRYLTKAQVYARPLVARKVRLFGVGGFRK
ncbi:YagK/YfjJ domain-containing protein [Luteimonas changyuni]|uniref:YagK/YfjJ domain-containing protein n=1 Tax=Luteimonas sp. MJ145 TaxID=3129234 RepID=UPI0031BB4B08